MTRQPRLLSKLQLPPQNRLQPMNQRWRQWMRRRRLRHRYRLPRQRFLMLRTGQHRMLYRFQQTIQRQPLSSGLHHWPHQFQQMRQRRLKLNFLRQLRRRHRPKFQSSWRLRHRHPLPLLRRQQLQSQA
jgi:hypothetical protein